MQNLMLRYGILLMLVWLGYRDKYASGKAEDTPFVLYEKYSRRDVSLLMNCGKDLSSTMYGMSRIGDDVFIFITYHKEEAEEGKNYADGKPDYADAFEDNLIFKWDSQIGKDNDSPYMKKGFECSKKTPSCEKRAMLRQTFIIWDNLM